MRTATINRKTKETDIKLTLCLDGGEVRADTGVGFFDHMLTGFANQAGHLPMYAICFLATMSRLHMMLSR